MVSAPIFMLPDWGRTFHVHVDASGIALGNVLAQQREGTLDHPMYFTSRKLSRAEHNYTTTEREGLAMGTALQKSFDYLIGHPLKFSTYHSALKYLVNKSVPEGWICRWLLLFQEFDFQVVVKTGKKNIGPDHLSCVHHGEAKG